MRPHVFLGIITCFLLGAHGSASADVIQVERLIQLPDGKPAIGAKVLVRSLSIKDGTLKQEKRVVTDEKGLARTELDVDSTDFHNPTRITAYMIVDVPGQALAFEDFSNWWKMRDVEPLVLSSGYELKGKVLTAGGEPVANAEVMLGAFASSWNNWRINYPAANIATPEAIGKTDATGSFELRPVTIIEQGEPTVRPLLIVRATKEGSAFTGHSESFARRAITPNAAAPDAVKVPENVIRVYPAATVRGRVVREPNGQPVAGVKVGIRADPGDDTAALISPVTSSADGRFEFLGVPASFKLFAVASHADYANGWTSIGGGNSVIKGDAPQLFENAEIRMRPLVEVKGKVIDVATNAAPLTPTSINSIYDEGFDDGRISVGHNAASVRMNTDGTFAMKLPVGANHLRVRGPGYWEGGYAYPIDLDIKAGSPENAKLVLPVRREKGFLTHFSTSTAKGKADYDFDAEYDLMIRGADGKESTTNWGEWWYWPLYKPEDTMEISVTRFVDGVNQEVMPWIKLTPNSPTPADSKNWPREIHLPLRQTVTLQGKVVDFETGKPVAGAKVSMDLQYGGSPKRTPPILSQEDGTFSFADVLLPKSVTISADISKKGDTGIRGSTATVTIPSPNSSHVTLNPVLTDGDEGKQTINDIIIKLKSLPE